MLALIALQVSMVVGPRVAIATPLGSTLRESRDTVPWVDPSPHRVQHVAVTPSVTLEGLDWGGSSVADPT